LKTANVDVQMAAFKLTDMYNHNYLTLLKTYATLIQTKWSSYVHNATVSHSGVCLAGPFFCSFSRIGRSPKVKLYYLQCRYFSTGCESFRSPNKQHIVHM